MSDAQGAEMPLLVRSDSKTVLRKLFVDILREDLYELLRLEGVDEGSVLKEADGILKDTSFDFDVRLDELAKAEQARDIALTKTGSWLTWVLASSVILFVMGILGLLLLLTVGIVKLAGNAHSLALWPFVVGSIAALTLSVMLFSIFIRNMDDEGSETNVPQTTQPERLRASLRDEVRSLVIVPAIERALTPKFIPADMDDVYLTSSATLSSRADNISRVQTTSYREVVRHLGQEGGTTIGVAGNRGVGKSELLRAFCEEPDKRPSIDEGGIIGIVVPAPVAYEPGLFLRVLIRRLAEAVPGYDTYKPRRPRDPGSILRLITFLVSIVIVFGGALLITGIPRISHFVVGWGLIAAGALISLWATWRLLKGSGSPLKLDALPTADIAKQASRIGRQYRQHLVTVANDVAQRVAYLETLAFSSEGSASFHNVGLKVGSGVTLGQVPLTEPDLALELAKFVDQLMRGGYRVRIGIDELDKLAVGGDAERFLTGIKSLFPIRGCSFLLSISEDAAAQFARRGMPIRDVFDSSLDSVVLARPLNFREARRLVRVRIAHSRRGGSERISDTQALLCHCLAGGLPRDFLRYCRQLGSINSRMQERGTLRQVLDSMVLEDFRDRANGVRTSFTSREHTEDVASFMAELELIEKVLIESTRGASGIMGTLGDFLKNDSVFGALCQSRNWVGTLDVEPVREVNSVRDARRQLLTYVYFIDTVHKAFAQGRRSGKPWGSDVGAIIYNYEILADARRQIETDAACGWRRITEARRALEIAPIVVAA